MANELESWARIERQSIAAEIKWFKAGSKLISPSGDGITATKVKELEIRLENIVKILGG